VHVKRPPAALPVRDPRADDAAGGVLDEGGRLGVVGDRGAGGGGGAGEGDVEARVVELAVKILNLGPRRGVWIEAKRA
jgi:hypothetical protein